MKSLRFVRGGAVQLKKKGNKLLAKELKKMQSLIENKESYPIGYVQMYDPDVEDFENVLVQYTITVSIPEKYIEKVVKGIHLGLGRK